MQPDRSQQLRAICALIFIFAVFGAGAEAHAASLGVISPPALAGQASSLVEQSTDDWTEHQLPDGELIDPVFGAITSSYGTAMTGAAMIEVGAATAREALISDGVRAEVAETEHPDEGGFELLALSEAFTWNEAHLAGNQTWLGAREALASFLSDHGQVVSDAGACYTTPACYDNLKLVRAVAYLALLGTGLTSSTPGSLLQNRAALHSHALALLAQAVANTGTDARRLGAINFKGAGILSDPDRDPLAYHALSTLMLGHAIELLGANTPSFVSAAFSHTARALIGLLAPDGNVAYIGRGQGQVWTVAATVDALSIAAASTASSMWRGRYLAGVELALSRLRTVYPLNAWGFPLVPRLAEREPSQTQNYLGIDGYANAVEYNGLSLWALRNATQTLTSTPAATAQAVPSTTNGAFLDPSHTQFTAVTRGNLWFVIHGSDSDPADARYDFGLVAAELRTAQGWQAALPYPPLTSSATTGGPALVVGAQTLRAVAAKMTTTANGEVSIHGGWARNHSRNPTVDPDTVWTYRPTAADNGIVLSFRARPGHTYQFQVWYQAGSQVTESPAGLTVTEPDGATQSYGFNASVSLRTSPKTYHSAYVEDLDSTIITVPAVSRSRMLTYTTLLEDANES